MTLPSRGFPLVITLAYNSGQSGVDDGFGFGWTFSYNVRYEELGEDILISRGDGRVDKYTRSGNTFIKPLGVRDSLEEYAPRQFRLTSPEGLQTLFESQSHKQVTSIRNPNGNTMSFTYNSVGQLATIVDTAGRTVSLKFANNHLTTVTDSNTSSVRTIQFGYDKNNNLTSITDFAGHRTLYGYSGHLLTSVTDARGETANIKYLPAAAGSGSPVVSSISTALTNKSFNYDEQTRTTTVTDVVQGKNEITKYLYDAQGRISSIQNGLGDSVSMTWDEKNNLTKSTNENGHSTTYTYDANNNVLTITDPQGNVTTFTHDPTFNKITSIRDANGHTTTRKYDAKANLIQTIDSNTANSLGGGGIENRGTLTIVDSTIRSNNANPGLGGAVYNFQILNLINSTVSGNNAGGGGGIFNQDSVILVNSTVSGNRGGGGAISTGGPNSVLSMFNSTVALNTATGNGGGILNNLSSPSRILLKNTIMANNENDNCAGDTNRLLDGGGNLQFPTKSCGENIRVADPVLGPLQNNGGPTTTRALLPGSPAIDAVPVASCTFDDDGNPATPEVPLTTDQRGVARPQGAACDIGAYEAP